MTIILRVFLTAAVRSVMSIAIVSGTSLTAQHPNIDKARLGGVTGLAVVVASTTKDMERVGLDSGRLSKAILNRISKSSIDALPVDDIIQGPTDHLHVAFTISQIPMINRGDAVFAVSIKVSLQRMCRVLGTKRLRAEVYCPVVRKDALAFGTAGPNSPFEKETLRVVGSLLESIERAVTK